MRWWVASVGYMMPRMQWAPTLTAHDPSYVLTINSPAAPAGLAGTPMRGRVFSTPIFHSPVIQAVPNDR